MNPIKNLLISTLIYQIIIVTWVINTGLVKINKFNIINKDKVIHKPVFH